jgi:hypothetical protein
VRKDVEADAAAMAGGANGAAPPLLVLALPPRGK